MQFEINYFEHSIKGYFICLSVSFLILGPSCIVHDETNPKYRWRFVPIYSLHCDTFHWYRNLEHSAVVTCACTSKPATVLDIRQQRVVQVNMWQQ